MKFTLGQFLFSICYWYSQQLLTLEQLDEPRNLEIRLPSAIWWNTLILHSANILIFFKHPQITLTGLTPTIMARREKQFWAVNTVLWEQDVIEILAKLQLILMQKLPVAATPGQSSAKFLHSYIMSNISTTFIVEQLPNSCLHMYIQVKTSIQHQNKVVQKTSK